MTSINYSLSNKRSENAQYIIYEGVRADDGKAVLLKSLKSDYPSHHDLNRLQKEYALLQKLKHVAILEVLDSPPSEHSPRIVMENAQGVRLSALIEGSKNVEDVLKIVMPIVEAVAYLHAQKIIHKNLNPENIYINQQDGNIKLVGFELAEEMAREAFHSNNKEAFEANVSYISPEQTGRMNRALDQRTDLYSLGVILYELLAQRTPFESDDFLGMIHCHIAKQHTPLSEVSDAIPMVVSDIVDKLLAKNTDSRYQSAVGLLHDLQRCISLIKSGPSIQDFELGEKDVSNRFSLSGNLYGRAEDLKTLHQSFAKVIWGQAELALVSGGSGMGKSALVKEVKKYVDQHQGFFVQGKFDQIKQNPPLNSLLSAFSQLIRQLFTESEEKIEIWKKRVLQAVGTNGGVLTDVMPELKLLIGAQPELPELPVAESTTRFNLVFNRFVQVFATEERPLCIFLDDLQWIDYTTYQWIESQFSNQYLNHILLIGAYRDNEVTPSHPVLLLIDHLESKGVSIKHIKLSPLSADSIANLIGDSIQLSAEKCIDIASIIEQKTDGNPFFIRQILLSLYEQEAIYFSNNSHTWKYDIDKVKETTISDNVIELMLELLHRLPTEVLETLKIASCIGNDFNLEMLSEINDVNIENTTKQLTEAIQLGLIIPKTTYSDNGLFEFSFQHDKIQQAAFSLLSHEDRVKTHLKIGNLLLRNTEHVEQSDKIYEITDHLNAAKAIITDEEKVAQLVKLNLSASIRAQAATAYRPALDYINLAMDGVAAHTWGQPSSLTRDLYVQRAESEHLCGNNEVAAEYFDKAVAHAETDLDKARVYIKKIHYYNNLGKFADAYETGRIAIEPLGTSLPAKFVPPLLVKDILSYRLRRGTRGIKDLIDVKEVTDEKERMAVLLMANVTKSAYQIKPELSIAVSAKIVNHYLKHGHAPGSSVGFLAFGSIFHGAILNQKKAGFDFGQLTLDIVEKYKTYQYKSEIHFVVGYFAIPWFRPAEEMERYWQIAYNAGLEIGDFFHASCAACGTTQSYFMRGVNFDKTLKVADRYLDFLNNVDYTEGIMTVTGVQQAIKNLQGKTKSRSSFSDDNFDEVSFEKGLADYGSRHIAHYYYINKMRTLYLWGEFAQAYEIVQISETYLNDSPGMLHTAEHFFYQGLIYASLYTSDHNGQRSKWKRALNKIVKRFRKYSSNCEANFIHKYQILEGEYERINENVSQSQRCYNAAITSAKEYGYLQVQALANQLLTQSHADAGNDRIAGVHLKDAIYGYQTLGAKAYADYLPGKFSNVTTPHIESASVRQAGIGNVGLGNTVVSNIDLTTILKSSEAISQQIRLKDLLATMMTIIIENAGAQRMVLLLKEGEELMVQAESLGDTQDVQILSKVSLMAYEGIAKSVVNHVIKANEPVILDDAAQSDDYSYDTYISTKEVRSVLCAPLTKSGNTIGVIYLENNLSAGVFTQDRIDLMIMLSGQMAISIENAMLYENLEEKVAERTKELNIEKEKSDNLLLNILPADIAEELKSTGKAKAKHFKQVTVLFADFKNFTKICEDLDAEDLVGEINYFYSAFDKIIMKHKIEKIKTIGDCYMCAGSLPTNEVIKPHPVVNAALEIRAFMTAEAEKRKESGTPTFRLRIGMHTGPVVAGIVGLKKFAYDIWGDTVNVASRMENNGVVGKINVSGDTYNLIKDDFECTYRGEVDVKNKGMVDMYFVEDAKVSKSKAAKNEHEKVLISKV